MFLDNAIITFTLAITLRIMSRPVGSYGKVFSELLGDKCGSAISVDVGGHSEHRK